MLVSQVQAASLEARKIKDSTRATLLVTLFAAMQKVGKDAGNRQTSDDEAVRVLKQFLKGVEEFLAVVKDEATVARLTTEKNVLESFLPAQADAESLKVAIAEIVASLADNSPKSMGLVMKLLKERFAGNYDGSLASKLTRDALAA